MKKILKLILPATVLILLFAFFSPFAIELKPGVKAPEFQLISVTGDTLDIRNFAGKVVILHFWKAN